MAIAELDGYGGQLRFAGLGNVAGTLIQEKRTGLASVNGTAGAEERHVRVYDYALAPGALLVLHSDGVSTKWSLEGAPSSGASTPAWPVASSSGPRPTRDEVLAIRYQGVE